MAGIGIVVHRIDADAVDHPYGPAYDRLRDHDDDVTIELWSGILKFLGPNRLRTHVCANKDAWPSASEYLAAMTDSPAVSALLSKLPQDGWIENFSDWDDAEHEEIKKIKDGMPTMLKWYRPLVRLGAYVKITADNQSDENIEQVVSDLFGDILVISKASCLFSFILRECPQDIEMHIANGMALTWDGPKW